MAGIQLPAFEMILQAAVRNGLFQNGRVFIVNETFDFVNESRVPRTLVTLNKKYPPARRKRQIPIYLSTGVLLMFIPPPLPQPRVPALSESRIRPLVLPKRPLFDQNLSRQTFSIDYYAKRILDYHFIHKKINDGAGLRKIGRDLHAGCDSISNRSD